MDAKLIEKIDRLNYQSQLLWTIAIFIMFCTKLASDLLSKTVLWPLIPCIVLLAFGFVKYDTVRLELKYNPELKQILDDELVRHYRYKSQKWGIGAMGAACLIFYMTARFIPALTIEMACWSIIHVGLLGVLMSQLVYMRK